MFLLNFGFSSQNEMLTLKQDNERLQRQAEHQSAKSSPNQTIERRSSHRSSVEESFVVTGKTKFHQFQFIEM